jgi:hypothetical protein
MNNNRITEQPDFANDQFTDLLLHKEDEPVVKNDEITNKPDDVEEKVLDNEQLPFNGQDKKNCWFPIHFTYEGKDYTADVEKTQPPLEEYHVTAVMPAIDHLPEPYIIAVHFSKEKFDFPVNETYYPLALGTVIVKAITEGYYDRRRTPVIKETEDS